MKLYKKDDYKTSLAVKPNSKLLPETIYLVPARKNHNSIKPDGDFPDDKKAIHLIELGNRSYNGFLKLYADGTFSQYRDGCFYAYVGKVAI